MAICKMSKKGLQFNPNKRRAVIRRLAWEEIKIKPFTSSSTNPKKKKLTQRQK